MDIRAALKSQYHAALAMLPQAIDRSPDEIWTAGDHPRTFWRIAYHALFYTVFYLQPDVDAFRAWEKVRLGGNTLSGIPWPPHDEPRDSPPYTKQEMLDYWQLCDTMIDEAVDRLDLDSPECGFPWYHMPKLDHQMMNIRHIQQHVGQLAERLCPTDTDPEWVG
ncbi:MAG TPA: DinB family protein [Armatimonadota bacterium]|nr:DinB family protein [Armatimonadota bacterium]